MTLIKKRVLFVCIYNSFRSQIAAAILNKKYGNLFTAKSAGINKKDINPLAVEVMNDYGVDISQNNVNSVFDLLKREESYDYVITVCSKEAGGKCPLFTGGQKKIHWELEDPDTFSGTHQEKLEKAILLRDEIEKRIDAFVKQIQ